MALNRNNKFQCKKDLRSPERRRRSFAIGKRSLPCDHLGIGQHQRADALGVVADHRLTEIVSQRAVAVVLAAEAGHEADAIQLQAAVRVLAQILVTGAVEGFLGPCGHPLGQVAETHALEHSVGEEGRAAGLEVVALDAGVVHHLPEHAGLLVLELVDVLNGLLEHRHDAAVLVVELLVHPLQHVHHRHHEPAHGPQPEVGAAAGDGVGLYYHGYDESRQMYWADPVTGCSPNFWLRAMGWFMVAMVDVLERMDEQLYNEYRGIMAMLKQTIEDVHKFQDEETGMFWQVMDHPGVEGNYLETSGTALFAYAVLKGVRLGYLPKRMAAWAEKAFYGTCDRYLSKNPDGSLQLDGICLVAGLGGKDHRDGSLAYYFSEPVVCNDAKGVGPLVLAYTEMIARK